jgi:CHASE3 domain sensor protein
MMKFNIKTKLKLLSGIFIAFLLLVGGYLLWGLSDVVYTFKDTVNLENNITRKAEFLRELVIDAETGQRGYIITGENEFLAPYENANHQFKVVVIDLRESLKDNPQSLHILDEAGDDQSDSVHLLT